MDLEILLPIHAVRQAKKKPRDVVAGYDGQQNNSWLLWRGFWHLFRGLWELFYSHTPKF